MTLQTRGAQRLYALLHEDEPFHDGWFTSWAKEPSTSHPFRYDDGVSVWLSDEDLTPDEDWLGQSVGAPGGDEPDGEVGESANQAD